MRRAHILDGDGSGGGHRAGTGRPGKTEFPKTWTDDQIIGAIESVANDSGAFRTTQPNGRTVCDGLYEGQAVRVIVERDGISVVTGFPINVPTNP
jgi:hypothetical protein